jgi:hypothetical protein
MSRTAQAGPAIGYLNTELERVWRGGHVVDSPVVCVSETWISGAKRYVVDVVDMHEPARGNSIAPVLRLARNVAFIADLTESGVVRRSDGPAHVACGGL